VIFNFGYLGTNKKQDSDPDISGYKYPIPDDAPIPFGHRKIMPDQVFGRIVLVPAVQRLAGPPRPPQLGLGQQPR
jgi:hypothetical protein